MAARQQAAARTRGGVVEINHRQSQEVIVLFKGDSQVGPMQLPLQKLAQITLSDLQAAWKEVGIEPYDWEESPATRGQNSPFPLLYQIQSYVAFEYECHYSEIPLLFDQSTQAIQLVHSEAAKRALSVLITVSKRQSSLKQGISFRSQVITWPPQTEVVPGFPEPE
jgi:hypothetical protein